MSFLAKYTSLLKTDPYKTKMLSSALIFGMSDVVCQKVVERKEKVEKMRVMQVA